MKSYFYPSCASLALFTLILGICYPLGSISISERLYPIQSLGSLLEHNGHRVGSELIGQYWIDQKYFWSRPSVSEYDITKSGATHFSPISNQLQKQIKDQKSIHQGEDVPPDLLHASGSGLDPHISPQAAYFQMKRIAQVRKLDTKILSSSIEKHIERKTFGILGQDRVNVLKLNLALDKISL